MHYRLDILERGGMDDGEPQPGRPDGGRKGQPFLMVRFVCANAYQRVHRSRDGTHYLGRCPKCGKSIRFLVGGEGTDQRMFEVSCQ